MNQSCKASSKNTILSINSMLHIVILFAFLSILFVFIISKLAREVLVKEITHSIEDGLSSTIKNLNPEQKNYLRKLPLEKLKKFYSEEHIVVQTSNKWFTKMIIFINAILVVIVTGFIITLKYNCGECPPIKDILIENAIVFTFIGIVEYLFFMKIAFKFIPSPPSHLLEASKHSLEKQLDKYSEGDEIETDSSLVSELQNIYKLYNMKNLTPGSI